MKALRLRPHKKRIVKSFGRRHKRQKKLARLRRNITPASIDLHVDVDYMDYLEAEDGNSAMKGDMDYSPDDGNIDYMETTEDFCAHGNSDDEKNSVDEDLEAKVIASESDKSDVVDDDLEREFNILRKALVKDFPTMNGGGYSEVESRQSANTFIYFVRFALKKLNKSLNMSKSLPLHRVIVNILLYDYKLVGEYLKQFENILKSSSILNYWNRVVVCSRWVHQEYNATLKKKKRVPLASFEHHMKKLRKGYSKKMKKELLDKSYEQMLLDGKIPKNGLRDLLPPIKKGLEWAKSLKIEDFYDKKIYNDFTDWLYSSIYGTGVQGRTGGLEDMQLSQGDTLREANNHARSKNFKTAQYHSFQAVSSSDIVAEGIDIFLEKARPCVARTKELNEDSSPLFLTFAGAKEYRFGAKVTNFFKEFLNLHITTTTIRSLYETEVDDLVAKGVLNGAHKDAVSRLGGHSGTTVTQYYIRKSMDSSVAAAREAMNVIMQQGPKNADAMLESVSRTSDVENDNNGMDDCNDDIIAGRNDNNTGTPVQYPPYNKPAITNSSSLSSASSLYPLPQSFSRNHNHSMYDDSDRLKNDDDDDVHQLRPLPLYVHKKAPKERYVIWSKEEIQYAQQAYCIIKAQLPPECQRMITTKVLDHIKQTPHARIIFHPSHIESSKKFRHVIRAYCE